jgi:hypothetical protein
MFFSQPFKCAAPTGEDNQGVEVLVKTMKVVKDKMGMMMRRRNARSLSTFFTGKLL